jgi:hypothetical protein
MERQNNAEIDDDSVELERDANLIKPIPQETEFILKNVYKLPEPKNADRNIGLQQANNHRSIIEKDPNAIEA